MFFLSDMLNKKLHLPKPGEALPGRSRPIRTATKHFVSKRALKGPYPQGLELAQFGLGSFWGAERLFWQIDGVWVTAVGYAGGQTPNPTYQEVCTGLTGHAGVVLVAFDPKVISYEALLRIFWEAHDPTQGMRQGNDVGTIYRSVIHAHGDIQLKAALTSRDAYAASLRDASLGKITTEIARAPEFYFAEAEHQQYLAKNSGGNSDPKGTGVAYPVSSTAKA